MCAPLDMAVSWLAVRVLRNVEDRAFASLGLLDPVGTGLVFRSVRHACSGCLPRWRVLDRRVVNKNCGVG